MKKIADKVFETHEYRAYETLTIEAEKEIRALVDDIQLKPDISSRTKTITSINDKIEREGYDDFLDEISDISGIRIACMTRKQKEHAISLMKNHFSVADHKPSKNDPYTMGYNDEKLILRLGSRYNSPDYTTIRDLKFEVQVRFIFMDAWAKFSHAFAYKDENSIPPELLRKIQIMGAACEMLDDLADDYAERINRFRTEIREEFTTDKSSLAATPINMESLQAYLEYRFPDMPIKRHIQSLIVQDINKATYHTIADIDHAVTNAKDFLDWYSKEQPELLTSGADYVTKALGWTDATFRRKHAFGSVTRKAFETFEKRH